MFSVGDICIHKLIMKEHFDFIMSLAGWTYLF